MEMFKPSGGSKPVNGETAKRDDAPRIEMKRMFKPQKQLKAGEGDIKSWSFSGLTDFETCQMRAFFDKVKKIPRESSEALDRGNRIHKSIEDYIQGKIDILSSEVKQCHSIIDSLRREYKNGQVIVEDEWAFNVDWYSTGWRASDVWLRMKLDALHWESETHGHIYDWKSGKKFGNEFKHSQQGQLYAIGAALWFEQLEHLTVTFAYTDHGETLDKVYTRDEALLFLPSWTKRGTRMTSCVDFIPSPSIRNCKFCSFKDHCEWSEK